MGFQASTSLLSRAVSRLCLRYVQLSQRHPWRLLLALFVLGLLCLFPVSELSLRTDFTELLPKTHPAAVAIREVMPRQLSSTNLVLIIESPDRVANRAFAESLRPKLLSLVGTLFSEVSFRPDTEIADAAALHKWHYAELSELEEAETLLDRLLGGRSNPLLIDLEGDAEAELKKIRDGMERRLPPRDDSPYFEFHPARPSEDYPDAGIHHLGVMLWRRGSGLASADDEQMIAAVDAIVKRANPQSFHPNLKVEYSGAVAMGIEEQRAVRSDLTAATGLTAALVLIVMLLHLRRLLYVLCSFAPALLGVLLSLVVARYRLQYLNANTAFLIAIILGNGINTSIVLLSRVSEARRSGLAPRDALQQGVVGALGATLSCALAASIAYGTLLGTDLRGLSQFGLVGGAGMLFCWLLTFLLLPPLLVLIERRSPSAFLGTPKPSVFAPGLALLGRGIDRAPRLVLVLVGVSLVAMLPKVVRFAAAPLEYDFSKLRTQDKNVERRWRLMYDLGLGNVGAGYIGRDGVLLVDRPEQADRVAQALLDQDRALGDKRVLSEVRTLSSVLPKQQEQKLVILRRIADKLDRYRKLISDEEWKELQDFRPPSELHLLTVKDLPRRVREAFTEVDGQTGRLVGIDADPTRFQESDGRELIRLSRSLTVSAEGKTWVAASASTLFAAMLEVIMADGPVLMLRCLLLTALLVLMTFGLRGGLPVLASLGVGMLWLLFAVSYYALKVNFLNFVAIPITIGIGVEYATNLWARYVRATDLPQSAAQLLGDTGAAVCVCSLTTIIGYGSLLLAQNQALQSFGKVACLGEATCLLAALVVIPAIGQIQHRGMSAKS